MTNLLLAGLRRYFYNPIWWLSVVASLVFGVFLGDLFYRENTTDPAFYLIPQMIFAVLISLSIAREKSGGSYRNKVIAGHSKGSIFLSELLLALGASFLLFLLFFIVFVMFSVPTISKLPVEIGADVWIGFLMIALSTSVLCYVIAMLAPRRTLGAVLCIFAVIGMTVVAEDIHYSLSQKEFTLDIHVVQNPETGMPETVVGGRIPNPHYVDGTKRTVYEILEVVNPSGQAEVYNEMIDSQLLEKPSEEKLNEDLERTRLYPLYSLGLLLSLAFLGWSFYRYRDIR